MLGIVREDNSVESQRVVSWGEKLDLDTYNQLVVLSTGAMKSLFA